MRRAWSQLRCLARQGATAANGGRLEGLPAEAPRTRSPNATPWSCAEHPIGCIRFLVGSSSSSPPAPPAHPDLVAHEPSHVVGQPVHYTHPELLAPGELAPGISTAEIAARRRRLCSELPPGSLVVLPSASTIYMSGVIPYPYRQDPDFLYLTGLCQHAVLVLQIGTTPGSHVYTLFIEPPDPERERWDGARVNLAAATSVFGADQAFHTDQLSRRLMEWAENASEVFFDADRPAHFHHGSLSAAIGAGMGRRPRTPASGMQLPTRAPQAHPLRPLLHAMRMRVRDEKSRAEAALMRRSAQLAADAMRQCIAISRPGVQEGMIAATFEYYCKSRGASRMAYPAVVAGGPDACTIHYGRNDKAVAGGQLLLMDAGCELHGYCSDVSRTWPVDGRFSRAQRDVYDVVRSTHMRCLEAVRPGTTLRQLHTLSVELLSEGISALRVFGHAPLSSIRDSLYRRVFWHSVGHWLGLDTHDTHLMGHDRVLQAGHVITMEPGLYIPDRPEFGHLRGIGVRIEDDVLVTPQGCEVLSSAVPHAVDDLEALVGRQAVMDASLPHVAS